MRTHPHRRKLIPIRVADHPVGRTDIAVDLYEDGIGAAVEVPFVVVRGKSDGPTVGICAAVHGDELNGIRIIHRMLDEIDPERLSGGLICAPIVNVPAYKAGQRRFPDGTDLNHSFPGKRAGRSAEQYARAFAGTFLPDCDLLVDIHTASEGRVNSFYVRADLHDSRVRELAMLMSPDITLHVRGGDGTLRNAAKQRGIPAITVEAGNPRVFQKTMVEHGVGGIERILRSRDMIPDDAELGDVDDEEPTIVCSGSRWIYTTTGGVLETQFTLLDRIERGQVIAHTRDPFGHVTGTYKSGADGIVIGMARNPVAVPGTRFLHLGAVGEPKAPTGAHPTA